MSSNPIIKPVITGALIVAADKFILKEPNLNKSLYFGAAGIAGVYSAGLVAKMLPVVVPSGSFMDGKTIELRLAEIGLSAGGVYAVNRFVLNNELNVRSQMMYNKLALIAAADFVAEYISDYLDNRPLSFFQ